MKELTEAKIEELNLEQARERAYERKIEEEEVAICERCQHYLPEGEVDLVDGVWLCSECEQEHWKELQEDIEIRREDSDGN